MATKKVEYTFHDKPASDVLDDIYYNANTKNLYVRFNNGRMAGYANVPASIVDNLTQASSVGRFYNSRIRGQYVGLDAGNIEMIRSTVVPLAPKAAAPAVGFPAPGVYTAAQAGTEFVVTGEVRKVTTTSIKATNIDAAIAEYQRQNPGSKVTEVTVKF